jgi:hypothetical protein
MNRNEIIAEVKKLGLTTEKPAHQCKTEYLQEVLNKHYAVTAETKQKGRPVNENSERQKRLAELEAKRAAGELRKGRPVVEGSARQVRLSLKGTLPLGRKPNPESAAYKRRMELEAKRAAGELKRGRPAQVKEAAEPVVLQVETPAAE